MATANTLDRYRNLKVLGSGGMGTVTLAEDTMLGRRVALKRLHTAGDPRGVSRLRREALVGASLSHPNLVSVYDVLTGEDGDLVVVMEYVAGETLRDAIRRRPGVPVAQAMQVLDGVAAGLEAIHERGIVHRDVKPANILLGTYGAIKLADLGVASVADRTQITTDGAVLGTFSYMAPEQLEGRNSDPAMDIYALAAVAYEIFSGRKARPEPNPLALAHAISTQPPPDLRQVWEEAPPATAAVLVRGMARNPAERPRSAGELMSRLRESFEPETTAPTRERPPRPPAPSPPRPEPPAAERVPLPPPRAAERVPQEPAEAAERVPDAPAGAAERASDAPAAAAERPSAPVRAAAAAGGAAAAARAAERAADQQSPPSSAPSAEGAAHVDAALAPGGAAARAPLAATSAASVSRGDAGVGEGSDASGRDARSPAAVAPRRRRAALLAGLLALAAAIVAAIVVSATSGGSSHTGTAKLSASQRRSATRADAAGTASGTSRSSSGAAPAAGTSSPSAPVPASTTPVGAVEAFYKLATAHSYHAAWLLADPAARAQLNGYGSFVSQQSQARSIRFNQTEVSVQGNTATVSLQTTSVLNNGSHQCSGNVSVVNTGGAWRVHGFQNINCT